ncbi:hypothetical protein NUU61_003038 [Penicillium alfredii]|uniref:ubiquitinyl hydrolase 1 n=1 Tax=Penicillium alfredii TaxID=1506179 RepID=A0A9W9KH49_9EURO|nr:uncharacterized protein NUU61_003038 [Penicillium alfredii]KAJ5105691.1 hypothetical protein NUU61_003038 [Penicillium alfredii]
MVVPYRAKGVPSDNAEFGHSDVAITLTCLSYYYEGLTLGQLLGCFTRLGKENDPSIIFQNWISRCAHELPDGLRAFTGVNIEDSRAFENLIYPLLRFQREVINFYLSQSVFPKAAKEFPRKLTTSAWDIPSQSGKQRTTGFSGTNDNRFLLPHSIHQCDLPQLLHNNAMVLGLLLRENNRQCVLAQDENGGHLNVDQLLETICRDCNARVLIDVGAQILEYRNQSVAQRWLSMTSESEIEAAIFFNNEDEVMVVDRQGHIEPLFSSLFRQRMNACLVFLDQEHSRGVDLKLPCDARAAVILGPRLTKDPLVQGLFIPPKYGYIESASNIKVACNRMRKLDKNQSVVFLVPPEVSHSMQALFNTESLEGFTSVHVLQWTMTQTCLSLDNLRPLWINHGLQYHRRMQLWRSLTSQHNFRPGILTRVQEPEARTLAELYAPWARPPTSSAQSNPGWDIDNPQVKDLLEGRKLATDLGISYCSLHEEQEREVECEVEREQQMYRPPPHLPREHILDENVKHFANFGKAKSGGSSTAIQRAFMSMQNTSVGDTTFPHCLGSQLWVTKDFIATVQLKKRDMNDEFMKPVNWVLSSIYSDDMVIVSQHEANELLPVIRKSPYSRLHLYRPRTTNTMQSFRNLDLFTTGAGAANYQPPEDAARDLELFAGSLYFVSFEDYKRFRSFLGLATDDVDKILEENLSNDGFVDEWIRRVMEWPVFSPFVDNPLPFLRVLMDIRTRGHKYERTHMGSIVGARPLTKDNF